MEFRVRNRRLEWIFPCQSVRHIKKKLLLLALLFMASMLVRASDYGVPMYDSDFFSSTNSIPRRNKMLIWGPEKLVIEKALLNNAHKKEKLVLIKNLGILDSRKKSNRTDFKPVLVLEADMPDNISNLVKSMDEKGPKAMIRSLIIKRKCKKRNYTIFVNLLELSHQYASFFVKYDEIWEYPMMAKYVRKKKSNKGYILIEYAHGDEALKQIKIQATEENVEAIISARTIEDIDELERKEVSIYSKLSRAVSYVLRSR